MPLVNLEEIKNTLCFDFDLVSKWFEENYTVLNADKCCFMCHISISNAFSMTNYKFSCIFNNFGIFVMTKLIPFDKIFKNSAGVVSLLVKQSNCCSY